MAHSRGFSRIRRLFAVAEHARQNGVSPEAADDAYEKALIGRRAVLRGMAATALIAAAPAALVACGEDDPRAPNLMPKDARVAVIGGGIAGLHCAYRLKNAKVSVTVYEAQSRVGGRIWSAPGVFSGGLLFELGGELIDSNHATMLALADELTIPLDDRWAEELPSMVRETWFIEGARVTDATLLQQTMAVSAVIGDQANAVETDDNSFDMFNNLPLAEWIDTYVPVATYPELHAVLRVAFINEFGLEAEEQSSLNLLYLFGYDSTDEFLIFGESDERWHVHGGNDLITTALAGAIGEASIKTGSKLIKAKGAALGPYTLTFEGPDGTFEVEADQLVISLPFTLLRKVDLTELELSDEKRATIAELGYGTNAKVMGEFATRPWWDTYNESGLLTTDLTTQHGWDTTIGQEGVGARGVWTHFSAGAQGVECGKGSATDWFSGTVIPDIELVWPGCAAAWTGKAERMHWPTFEWSLGSYLCYRPGQWEYWSTEGAREGNVHFCGEHCSVDFQGWMEGAAETGGLVAAAILEGLGVKMTALHARAIEAKMAAGHPCYDAAERTKPRFMRRSRRLRSL